jgi:hypothetical protein
MARLSAPRKNHDSNPTPPRQHRPVRLSRRPFADLFDHGWGGTLAPLDLTSPSELPWGVSATETDQGIVIRAEMPGVAERGLELATVSTPLPAMHRSPFTVIDVAPHANQKLTDPFPGGVSGNDLAFVPTGQHAFAGIDFLIGGGVVHLGSARVPGPDRVEGIRVGRRLTKLHFLHSCACGYHTPDGTVIGQYVVCYDDRTTAEVPIVFGEDVRDWWSYPGGKGLTRGRVGWEGDNAALKGSGIRVKLSVTTWENPCPRKEVASLDYVAAAVTTDVAPFCVAITAEER